MKLLLAGVAAAAIQPPLLAQDAPPPEPPAQEADTPAPPAVEPPAQDAQQPADDESADEGGGEEIVVTGTRERGAVAGDIDPEVQLSRRDIRTFGAGSIAELLDALAPQTRSGRGRGGGGGPVVLLNGRRISSFAEIRDIPPEAIDRVDILPEEVALKYGYRADQRVVNFVLRRRFRAVTAEAEGGFATDGGRGTYRANVSTLRIGKAGRVNLAATAQHNDPLFESERDIVQAAPDPAFNLGDFRTLLAATDQVALNGTVNRTILGDVSATANARFEANESRSFLGRRDVGNLPLIRDTDSLAGHVGLAFNGDIQPWRWSATANYDRTGSDTVTQRNGPSDRAHTITDSGTAQLVASGPLFALPAGNVTTTVRGGFDALGLSSETFRSGLTVNRDLSRERGSLQANVDVPIASRRRDILKPIGDLSLNLNGEVEHFSDFGTLRTLGAGLTWSPIPQLDVIASMTDEDGAPSMQQLGDPVLVTPAVRVFDFTRGETVDIDRIDGGNPALLADNRRVYKLGFTLKPFTETDLSLTANYTSSRILDPISSFPAATPEIEAAFPDRFFRDASGRLIRVDNRPVNFARSDRDELRWGINFSKRIGPAPQPGAFRRGGGAGGAAGSGGPGGAAGQSGGQGAQGGGGPRGPGGGGGRGGFGGGRGGFGGFGGGNRGGQLQFAIYHNWRFADTILIRPGVPELDLLNGSATGSSGGSPRHEIEVQAGIFKNGLGARLSGNWQNGTVVRGTTTGVGATSSTLFFSDFATANLRFFADLGAQRQLVRAHPWLRGTRISIAIDNLFNNRIDVRDETGATPLSFQPGFVDPLGRSVRISIRKLFF